MKNQTTTQPGQNEVGIKRSPYEAPAIIYEGLITTRAGSVPQSPDRNSGSGAADPGNAFGGPGS